MSKHYKKLILLLIPLSVGFFLALALGSAEEPSELSQEEKNKHLVMDAIGALYLQDVNQVNELFDPNYIHHLPAKHTHFTLYETISWFHRFDDTFDDIRIRVNTRSFIAEGYRVVVLFHRDVYDSGVTAAGVHYDVTLFSSEIWILHIANGKVFESWSVSEPGLYAVSQEENNMALVRDAILVLNEDPSYATWIDFDAPYYAQWQSDGSLKFAFLPEQFDPNYIQWGPWDGSDVPPSPYDFRAGTLSLCGPFMVALNIERMFAQGDMVFVQARGYFVIGSGDHYFQQATYRIANGKIVEGWISMTFHVSVTNP